MTNEAISVSIPVSLDAAFRARAIIDSLLVDDPHSDDVKLATSELISNAVKHGDLDVDEAIRLEIRRAGSRSLRVAVTYRGEPFDRPDISAPSSGYGFRIVDALSTRWAVDHHNETTTAWFEI